MPYDNEKTGLLFKKDNKVKPSQPDYTGWCTINGEKLELAGWIKKSKEGKPFLSLRFQEPKDRAGDDGKPPF